MNLIRLLIIAAVIWILYRMIQTRLRSRKSVSQKPDTRAIETVVKCDYCGLHIPEEEAVRKDGKSYCSRQHLESAEK